MYQVFIIVVSSSLLILQNTLSQRTVRMDCGWALSSYFLWYKWMPIISSIVFERV